MKLIAAVNSDWGIGMKGKLLCNIPADLKHFKETTKDGIVVMGVNTWNSLPYKPLKNRTNIIVTTHPEKYTNEMTPLSSLENDFSKLSDGVVYTASIEDIIQLAASELTNKTWVIGGGQIYQALIPYCKCAVITFIENAPPADTYMPNLYELGYSVIDETTEMTDNGYKFTIKTLVQ